MGVLLSHGFTGSPASMVPWGRHLAGRGRVTQPINHFRSAEDHVVDPSSARIIAERVSSAEIEERVLENSYHVATLDHDAPVIFEESVGFIRRVALS